MLLVIVEMLLLLFQKAGGMGVLGAVGLSPEKLEIELNWIDEHVDGKPYGVDVLVPNSYVGKGENLTTDDLRAMIPQEHREFRADVLEKHDIEANDLRSDAGSQRTEQKFQPSPRSWSRWSQRSA